MNIAVKRVMLASLATLALGASTQVSAQAVTLYSVRAHDTVAKIAQEHHIAVDRLKQANAELRKSSTLKPGQVIVIPDRNEAVNSSRGSVVIHSYQIINPNPPRTLLAEVKSDSRPAAPTDKVDASKTDVPKTEVAKTDVSKVEGPASKVVDTAPAPKTVEPVKTAAAAPAPSSLAGVATHPVTVAVSNPSPVVPQPDTQIVIEGDSIQPAASADIPVTHMPVQDNIAIIDSQVIHVPTYVAPLDSTPTPGNSSSSLVAAADHHPTQLSSRHGSLAMSILAMAHHFIGIPYVWGGTTPSGFDCSGFTQRVFALSGVSLPRLADAQYYQGTPVKNPAPGDLVFFSTYLPGPSHVGIYLGGNQFIHASSRKGVTISSLSEAYYAKAYIGARRYY